MTASNKQTRGRKPMQNRVNRITLILDTVERLFYARGVRGVGMDELVRETGLSKMAVYRLFPSKDKLVVAYLQRRMELILGLIDEVIGTHPDDPHAALNTIMESVERDVARPDFRGCPFNNACVNFDNPTHPARLAALQYKQALFERLAGLTAKLTPEHGRKLAAQLHLIIDGIYLSAGILGASGPASEGREVASQLIERFTTQS